MSYQYTTGLSKIDKVVIWTTYLAWIPLAYAIGHTYKEGRITLTIGLIFSFVVAYLAYLTNAARMLCQEKAFIAEQKRYLLRAIAEGREIIVSHKNIAGEQFMINEYDMNTDLVLITSLSNKTARKVPIKQLEISK